MEPLSGSPIQITHEDGLEQPPGRTNQEGPTEDHFRTRHLRKKNRCRQRVCDTIPEDEILPHIPRAPDNTTIAKIIEYGCLLYDPVQCYGILPASGETLTEISTSYLEYRAGHNAVTNQILQDDEEDFLRLSPKLEKWVEDARQECKDTIAGDADALVAFLEALQSELEAHDEGMAIYGRYFHARDLYSRGDGRKMREMIKEWRMDDETLEEWVGDRFMLACEEADIDHEESRKKVVQWYARIEDTRALKDDIIEDEGLRSEHGKVN